jgi:hypothetical protein
MSVFDLVEKANDRYCQALEDFLHVLEANEENVGEFAIVTFSAIPARGVYRDGKLIGSVYVINSNCRTLVVCQDMRS